MPPRKRSAPEASEEVAPKRRSLRQAASKTQPEPEATPVTKTNTPKKPAQKKEKEPNPSPKQQKPTAKEAVKPKKPAKKQESDSTRAESEDPDIDSIPTTNPNAPRHDGQWYWLMKAEPETRIENGVDVKFSIDDLRAKTEPEGWDGEIHSMIL
ncbi:hypothetical protein SNK03_010627 [Fusarium graminearum]